MRNAEFGVARLGTLIHFRYERTNLRNAHSALHNPHSAFHFSFTTKSASFTVDNFGSSAGGMRMKMPRSVSQCSQ